jgi:hypothetical protein
MRFRMLITCFFQIAGDVYDHEPFGGPQGDAERSRDLRIRTRMVFSPLRYRHAHEVSLFRYLK